MIQIQIFSSSDYKELQDNINDFIEKYKKIKVIDIKLSTDKICITNGLIRNAFTAMIVYEVN